jgi:hypothetical protein
VSRFRIQTFRTIFAEPAAGRDRRSLFMVSLVRFLLKMCKPQSAESASDEQNCPICLETLSDKRAEICENGHRMHRECALQMHFHMTSQCPLCRSMLMCLSCGFKKKNMRCKCSGIPDHPAHGWTMVKYQICLLVAIILVPHKDWTSISLVFIVNFAAMIRQIITSRPMRAPGTRVKGSQLSWLFLILNEIGSEVLCVLFTSFTVALVHSWCVGQK